MKWVGCLPIIVSLLLGSAEPPTSLVIREFPGLDELVRQSDAILVVDPVERKPPNPSGLGEYTVSIKGAIKGKAATGGTIALSLRSRLLSRSSDSSRLAVRKGLEMGKSYIVFLSHSDEAAIPHYSTLPYCGGHMEVVPGQDLSWLGGGTAEQNITKLLKDFLEYKTQEFWDVELPLKAVVSGGVGSTSAQPDLERRKWAWDCLKDFQSIKPGMTRREIQTRFPLDGGIYSAPLMRFVHPQCDCFKIDVKFSFQRNPKDQGRAILSPDDPAVEVSKPYIELAFAD
jgi:hypothetical protein